MSREEKMKNQVSRPTVWRRLVFLLSSVLVFILVGCRKREPIVLPDILNEVLGEVVDLKPTPQAQANGFGDASGQAVVDVSNGEVRVTVSLPDGVGLPAGSIFEAWVVDAGETGGQGKASASDADEKFGISFGNQSLDQAVDNAPYALSLGVLKEEKGKWIRRTSFGGELTPYDQVMVTLESDGGVEDYDPRPGSPFLTGEIAGEGPEEGLE